MIEFFSVGQRAEGFIAIGQEATGVIAIGQFATGVFALGQVARGGIAIGQAAFGVVSVGMLSVGLVYSVGMVGAGGRGLGFILPLVPGPLRRGKLPGLAHPDAIRAGRETGWLPVRLLPSASGPTIQHATGPIAASIAANLQAGVQTAMKSGVELLGLFGAGAGRPELRRLQRITDAPLFEGPIRWVASAAQVVLLGVACALYWQLVLVDVGDFLLTALRYLVTST